MTGFEHAAIALGGALAFDLAVGEPPNLLHPVVWMGRLQRALRRRAPRSPGAAFAYGALMALSGPLIFGGGAWLLLHALAAWPWAQLAVEIYLLKSAFAIRALGAAAARVARALRDGDVPAARAALRSLVSRDVSALGEPLLAAAAIESVAENTSDSLVAPLVYYLALGVPGALAYRAANTLDALIGYHGETEWLGKAAARLDDALNLIPARLTALLLVAGAAICRRSPARALRTWWRDAAATESPNAGRPMAAMAGALGVQLEKVGCYRLGAGGAEPAAGDVERSIAIMAIACALAAALVALGAWMKAHGA
ncbi:MAG TPA: adenosylcobinamide-phosphate synthase CbiB [Polyangia bacterium]|nr:adenosylcobinamide-phosphate synthase CbiB [Polyangia bacterium]